MFKNIFNFLIAIYPILSAYKGIDVIDLGTIVLLFFGILCFLFDVDGFKLRLPQGFMLFFIVAIITSIIFIQSIPLRLVVYTISLIFACSYLDVKKLVHYYSKIVFISCVFFLIQEIFRVTTGNYLIGIASFLPTVYDKESSFSFYETYSSMMIDRSSSFFLEPSYFAQFLFPYVVYALFFDKTNNNLRRAILVTLIMVMVRSGMGIILLGIIWIIWLLMSKKRVIAKIAMIISLGMLILFVVSYNQTLYISLMERSDELLSYEGNEQYFSSGFIRFFRGYYLYGDLPLINQLFGASDDMIIQYRDVNAFFWQGQENFFNGIQTILLHNGIFVLLLFLRCIFLLSNKVIEAASVVFIVCILLLLLGESYYLSSRMFFVLVMIYGLYQKNIINKPQMIYKV